MKRSLVLALVGLLMSVSASAGLLVEPYLGFRFGSGENSSSPKTEYSYNSPLLGGRLGYQFLGLMAGLDYSTSLGNFSLTEKTSGVETKGKYTSNTFGLFVGYDFPILLRAWATYYLSNTLKGDSGSVDGDKLKGGGYGLGVGFTGLPFISLNLELRQLTWDESFDNTTGVNTKLTGSSEVDVTEVLLSVSLPLDL